MFGIDNTGSALDTIAHIIQVALTPVFLLSGIATLLNVFSTLLARVADQVDAASKALDGADADGTFQFGGQKRRDPVRNFLVRHGDAMVWGGVSRLAYPRLSALKSGQHPLSSPAAH